MREDGRWTSQRAVISATSEHAGASPTWRQIGHFTCSVFVFVRLTELYPSLLSTNLWDEADGGMDFFGVSPLRDCILSIQLFFRTP